MSIQLASCKVHMSLRSEHCSANKYPYKFSRGNELLRNIRTNSSGFEGQNLICVCSVDDRA
jgi:hypothetical protein